MYIKIDNVKTIRYNQYKRRNTMIYIKDLIRNKKEGKELTEEEIKFFIQSYNREEILKLHMFHKMTFGFKIQYLII